LLSYDALFARAVCVLDILAISLLHSPTVCCDAFVRMNRRAIAMMFVRLSVYVGRACIVIIQCTLAQI